MFIFYNFMTSDYSGRTIWKKDKNRLPLGINSECIGRVCQSVGGVLSLVGAADFCIKDYDITLENGLMFGGGVALLRVGSYLVNKAKKYQDAMVEMARQSYKIRPKDSERRSD